MSRGGILPFKISEDLKFAQKLAQTLLSHNPKGDTKYITKFCQEMEKLRKILDFSMIQKQTHQDFRLSVEFELLVVQYYAYLRKLDFLFSNCVSEQEISIEIVFKWNNSFNQKSNFIGIEKLEYEIISILYNLSILYYYQGIYFISFTLKSEKLKGITKLRNFIWAISQIEKRLSHIESQIPSDLDPSILKCLTLYAKGLILSVLGDISIIDSSRIDSKIAGMYMKSGKLFEESLNKLQYIDSEFLNLKLMKMFKNNVSYNLLMSKNDAFAILNEILIQRAQENPTKGYMGNAVYYTQIIKKDLEPFTNKSETAIMLTKDQKEKCIKEFKIVTKLLEERTKLNDKLYVEKETWNPNLSEFYEEIHTDISPLEPSIIQTSVLQDLDIISFASDSIRKLILKVKERVEYYKYELNREEEKIILIKDTIYKRYDAPSIISGKYKYFKEPEIPNSLKDKISLFNQKGGLDSLLAHSSMIVNLKKSAQQNIDEIDQALMAEMVEDEMLQEKYGKEWDRKPSSTLNGQYINKLKDLRNRLDYAHQNDQKNIKGVDDMRNWMVLFQSDIKEILAMFTTKDLKKSQNLISRMSENIMGLDYFLNNSYAEIKKAKESFGVIDENIILTDALKSYQQFEDQESLLLSLISSHMRDFDRIFDMVKFKIQFNLKFGKHMRLLHKMTAEIHKLISQLDRYENKKVEQDWLSVLGIIETIRENFIAGETFYNQLIISSKTLKDEVRNFCQIRNEENLKSEGIIKYLEELKNKKKEPLFS